jgi:formate hydrogenlyase transcriptional activator
VGLTEFSLHTLEEHGFAACVLSEPERALAAKEAIVGELTPLVPVFHGLGQQADFDQFLQGLPARLRPNLSFYYLSLVLKKEDGSEQRWYVPNGDGFSTLAGTDSIPVEEPLLSWVMNRQEALVIPDFVSETRFSIVRKSFLERGLRSVCAVPLTTSQRAVGAILIASPESDRYSEYAEFFRLVADQIAMALDNALSHAELKRFEVLSRLSQCLAASTLEDLSRNLAAFLHPFVDFDFLDLLVFKEGSSEVLWHSIGRGQLPPPDVPIEETTCWWVYQQQQALCIADWRRDDRFAARREALKKLGFEYRYLCRVPLRTPHQRLGMLSVASPRPHDCSGDEARFLSQVADKVASAVAHALDLERVWSLRDELKFKSAQLRLLLELSNSLAANRGFGDVLKEVTVGTRRLMQSDLAVLGLVDPKSGQFHVNAVDFPEDPTVDEKAADSLGRALGAHVLDRGKPWTGRADDFAHENTGSSWTVAGFNNACVLPLVGGDQVLGFLAVGKREDTPYSTDEVDLLSQVSRQLATTAQNALVHGEFEVLQRNPDEERVYRENEIRSDLKFREIVGKSPALYLTLGQIEVVAPTDSAVLIQGETGTGKELLARSIHDLSARRDRPFVKVNCAAIPSGLLESELFGHEKGAFTGAIMRKAGRFELADKGTLFLDEVGDIPLELQPKLLRVLQEHEFERLGSTRTQQVDVRVIAATHRDLKQMVEDGQFRSDLFYRLHVFPIAVPALRDRTEDIPVLVRHFVDKCARRMNRRIETIPSEAMEIFMSYAWPGNVRELQNFIERAVILSPGSVLRPPLAELKSQEHNPKVRNLEKAEREHILRALRASNWVIAGPGGAAAKLGMKRTTLAYRIRKLKISCRPE